MKFARHECLPILVQANVYGAKISCAFFMTKS